MKAETFQNLEKRYSKLKYSKKQNPQHWKHVSKMEEHTLTMLVQNVGLLMLTIDLKLKHVWNLRKIMAHNPWKMIAYHWW